MKHAKGKRKLSAASRRRVAVSAVLVVLAAAAVIAAVLAANRSESTETPSESFSESTGVSENTSPDALELPLTLENGTLELASFFRYDGANPDAAMAQGDNIAAVELKNTSGVYIVEAQLELELSSGRTLHFTLEELPNGESALALSLENTSVGADELPVAASASVKLAQTGGALSGISVFVNGDTVTLQNLGGTPLDGITVYCRALLDERYFGGVCCKYKVNTLPAYGTVSLTAEDCIFGEARVVRVTVGEDDKGVQE